MCLNLLIQLILMTYIFHGFISMIYLSNWLSCFIDSFHWFLRSIDWLVSLIDLFHWFVHFSKIWHRYSARWLMHLAEATRHETVRHETVRHEKVWHEGFDTIALVPVVVVTPTFNVPPLEHSRTGLGQTKRTGRPRPWQGAPTPNLSLSASSKSFPLPWSTQ
jgi:hypothetical protein